MAAERDREARQTNAPACGPRRSSAGSVDATSVPRRLDALQLDVKSKLYIGGVPKAYSPPDPEPAIRVRRVLAYDKRLGVPFDDAWDDAIETLRDAIPQQRRKGWLTVLDETRDAWQAAYEGRGASVPLSVALLD